MHIIAGSLGGRMIQAPHGHRTHPMADKIRGALFNILGDIDGLTVLDAFAGSGALSLEAISRGAKSALAIDQDKNAYSQILKNLRMLEVEDQIKATRANASSWSDHNPDAQFDIIILAPPYDHLQESLLAKLTRHAAVRGLLVLDWPGHKQAPQFDGFEQVKAKNYGDAQLAFYRKI